MKRDLESHPALVSDARAGKLPADPVAQTHSVGRYGGQIALRRVAFGGLLLLALALVIGGWSFQQRDRVHARGAIVRGELTEMGTRFSGMLLSADARPGVRVRAGDVLGRLDDRHLRAQESETAAQVEALERELVLERASIEQERATRGARVQEISARALAARGEIRAARLRVVDAEEQLRVRKELAESGIISQEALREVRNRSSLATESFAVSQSNAQAADSALRSTKLDLSGLALREQRLGVLDAQLNAARARHARVRADLASTLITAPADGTVVRWLVNAGGSVDVGKPVVSFSLGTRRWVEAWVDEDDAGRIRAGDAVTVTMPFHAGRELQGTVSRMGLTTEAEPLQLGVPDARPTRIRQAPVVPVEVALAEVPESLLPGLSAVVAIRTSAR